MTTPTEYCPFVVGDRVVCVDAKASDHPKLTGKMHGLTEGRIYTVRWVGSHEHAYTGTCIAIRVKEIYRGTDPAGECDVPYRASRFRPAPSISVFTELLSKAPAPVDEVAG